MFFLAGFLFSYRFFVSNFPTSYFSKFDVKEEYSLTLLLLADSQFSVHLHSSWLVLRTYVRQEKQLTLADINIFILCCMCRDLCMYMCVLVCTYVCLCMYMCVLVCTYVCTWHRSRPHGAISHLHSFLHLRDSRRNLQRNVPQ